MKKFLFFKMLLFAQFFIFSSNIIYSQDCPPITPNWTSNVNEEIKPEFVSATSKLGYIDYYTKVNSDGSIDVKIDWSTLRNEMDGYFGINLTDDELKGFVYLEIIHRYLALVCLDGTHQFLFTFYETSFCNITHKCYFHSENVTTTGCVDTEFLGGVPNPYQDPVTDDYFWYDTWVETCGTKCCKHIYSITGINGSVFFIDNIAYSEYSNCNSTVTTYDCKTNVIENCIGNCP